MKQSETGDNEYVLQNINFAYSFLCMDAFISLNTFNFNVYNIHKIFHSFFNSIEIDGENRKIRRKI